MNKKRISAKESVLDYISVNCLQLSRDAIFGKDESFSLIKMIDQIETSQIPVTVGGFIISCEVQRSKQKTISEFETAKIEILLTIKNPQGEEFELAKYRPGKIDETDPWIVSRLVLDMSGFTFKSEGDYLFVLKAGLGGDGMVSLHERVFPVNRKLQSEEDIIPVKGKARSVKSPAKKKGSSKKKKTT